MSQQEPQIKQALFQVLSLDVVLGSLAVGIFAVKLLAVQPNPVWFLVLAGSVWVVYTLDHLLDGFRHKGKSRIYRHGYHYKNRKALIAAVVAVSFITIGLALTFLDKDIITWGIYLSLFVMGYFALHYLSGKSNRSYFQKELIIAAVYISGIFLAPLVWLGGMPDNEMLIVIAMLFLLAWAESIIISYYDYDLDRADKLDSFTITYGKKGTRSFLIFLLSTIVILLSLSIFGQSNPIISAAMVIELLMGAVLLLLIFYPDAFKRNGIYRWIGEGVFYLPGLLVLL